MEEVVAKVTPYNETAEQSVLGSMLVDPECIGTVMQTIKSDDFYNPKNKEIFNAFGDLFSLGKSVDVLTLAEQLKLNGVYEKIGGEIYLSEIISGSYTSANVYYYAQIISDYATRRRLIEVSNSISDIAYKGDESVEKMLDISEQRVFDISEKRAVSTFYSVGDVLSVNYKTLSELAANPDSFNGIPSGFSNLDKLITGFVKGNFVLIAARPAMGKTSFALNIAQHVACKQKMKVAIFSLEMSKEEIVNRLWVSEAMVENDKVKKGKMEPEDWIRLTTALSILSEAPIYIDDTASVTPMDIRAKCRRLAAEKGLDMIIIDHIQLMESSKRNESRQAEITEISRNLKMIAKDLNVPVIALSQLSRASAKRDDKRPVLTDLRESGAIEQDADIVMMIYRDDYYNPETTEKPGEAEIIVQKNRAGETGKAFLKWQGEFTRFSNIDYVHKE